MNVCWRLGAIAVWWARSLIRFCVDLKTAMYFSLAGGEGGGGMLTRELVNSSRVEVYGSIDIL